MVMDNLIYGLQSIGINAFRSVVAIIQHPVVWGFALGFGASTIVHLVISSENPSQLPQIALHKDTAQAFTKVAPRDARGNYMLSYTKFEEEFHRTRALLYTVILAFLGVTIIAMLRY